MAVFKCKACGGNLDVTTESRIVKCEFCDTSQTVPVADNDKKTNLFNRANKLRMSSEFDKAAGVYESIAAEFPEEAEAYWGLCLCKYGIEYVDDPLTGKKIPTCHRTSYDPIMDDDNFNIAIENSDSAMVKAYREEAKEIDRIQKSILEIASKEEPFDIFICYKETAEDGQRTKDSVLAQDMYDALTDKGYKVFFSRITLEDKLGREYEPYIFSALNSAKVMLSVGTKYEYFNAVWVKNEWKRFLDLMQKDKKKILIPCYCDIDAYDMPPEFKNLQGQDMNKVGFIQDLVRNIGKIVAPVQEAVTVGAAGGATVDSLIMRATDFLKYGNWNNAMEYSKKVLDINPRYAPAYLTSIMAQFNISAVEDIDNCCDEIRNSDNYRMFMEFADEDLKAQMHPHFEKAEISRKCYVYKTADSLAQSNDINSVKNALPLFVSIEDWEDSKERIAACRKRIALHELNCRKKNITKKMETANKELKQAKKDLRTSKNIFRIFWSVFWLAAIIVGAILIMKGFGDYEVATTRFQKDDAAISLLIGMSVYLVSGTASIMRLFGWDSVGAAIGAFFLNSLTVSAFGIIASIIKLIKDRVEQSRDIKACKNAVNSISAELKDLKTQLSSCK